MGCCKAEEHELFAWCQEIKDVQMVEFEGKEYCIFHAPAECPEKQDVEGFNKKVFERINAVNRFNIGNDEDNDCSLRGTIFLHDICFTKYSGKKCFPSIDFSYARFYGYVSFANVAFSGPAHFRGAKFFKRAIFKSAIFQKRVYFGKADFKDEVDFGGALFLDLTFFKETKFTKAAFKDVEFQKQAYFRDNALGIASFEDSRGLEMLVFEGVHLEGVSLLKSPIESFRFIDCHWPEKLGRTIVFDEFSYTGFRGSKNWSDSLPGQLADLYRRLKKIAMTEQDHFMAGRWHYNQKKMERQRYFHRLATPKIPLLSRVAAFGGYAVLTVYKWLCGYGEGAVRGLICLSVLIVLPFLHQVDWQSMQWVGFKLFGEIIDEIFSIDPRHFLPFMKAPDNEKLTMIQAAISGFWRIFLTVQAGLFGLALRNKLRR